MSEAAEGCLGVGACSGSAGPPKQAISAPRPRATTATTCPAGCTQQPPPCIWSRAHSGSQGCARGDDDDDDSGTASSKSSTYLGDELDELDEFGDGFSRR